MSTANKPTESVSLNAFKQPKAFYLIFSIELWERFGYYGLRGGSWPFTRVKQLGMSEADSITLFSSFSALVYGTGCHWRLAGRQSAGHKTRYHAGRHRAGSGLRAGGLVWSRRRHRVYGDGGDRRG